ncbi:MAG: S9 family peptidase [Thermoplasmata archaeon]|nr:S9 family peptidase [Thermoplasmata archaeon]TFG71008.1 MAG: S9 family peptidase [Methanomassiliicoccus sp.]
MNPPRATKKPKKVVVHGDELVDEYHWLRDRSDPDTLQYIMAENSYTDAKMEHTVHLQERLYEELAGRAEYDESMIPTKVDDYYYYTRTEVGKQYGILCRRKGDRDSPEEIVLDENAMAVDHDFFAVGAIKISPDHRLVAYSADTNGSELNDLFVLDVSTKKLADDGIPGIGTFEWGSDSRTIYYVIHDATHRPFKVLRHSLGADRTEDAVVHHEQDPRYEYLVLTKTKSREYILATGQSLHTSEVGYIRSDDRTGDFKTVIPRKEMVKYYVEHRKGSFLIITNDGAPNFKIVEAPIEDPTQGNWKDTVPHRDSIIINISDPYPWVEAFADHIAVFEREDAITSISVFNLNTGENHRIALPEELRSVTPLENPDISSHKLRFSYSSFLTPKTMYEYDMDMRELHQLQQERVHGYDREEYESERLFAVADDGTRIPITVVHKKSIAKDGGNPLLLYAYGSAGDFESTLPIFDINNLSLLDRGFVYAVAAIRGGGEMGRQWYDDGRVLRKKNSFTDFIRSAEHLIAMGYTSKEKLAIAGGSAGGLLVAAVMNMRPDLFRAVVAEVPFVDVIHTMLDKTIPLVAGDSEEYGDPAIPEQYWYCKSFSPYENVEEKEHPNLLVTSAMNDPRVPFWEPVKWIARLRDRNKGSNVMLLRTGMNQGHMRVSARYDALRHDAFKMAFILDTLGISE